LLAAEIVFPTAAYALTGGPSQPEVEGFQAISVNDMVDPFTGDFSYNIPLLDIDGYPINLVYQSGVSMDAEASWVGLGWNLNAGSLTRSMRGIPDDFKGDLIKNELYMKPNNTFGVTGGIGLELFGKESKGSPPKVDTISQLNLNFSLGTRFNNYSGIGIEISISAALSAAGKIKNKLNGSLGLTSSSDNGVSLEPSIGLSSAKEEKDKYVIRKKSNVGLSFNSREGLKDVTISASYSKNIEKKDANSKSKNRDWKGGPSGTFNFGYSSHTPEVQTSMKNLSISARFTVGAELFGVHGNWYVNGYFSGQKLKTNITESPAFGYLYAEGSHGNPESVMDFNRERDGGFTPNAKALPLTNFTYDIYSASAHGSGGSFRPMRGEVSYVRDNAGRTISAGGALGLEFGVGNAAHNGVNIAVNYAASNSGMWTSDDNASSKLLMRSSNSPSGVKDYENVYFIDAGERGIESDTSFYNSFGGAEPMRFVLKKRSKFQIELSNQLTNGNGQSRYLPAQNHRKVRARRNQVFHILTRAMHEAGFGIQDPHPNSSDVQAHHVSQVMTYSTEGARYVYGIAAYNNLQQDVSFSVGDRMYSSNSGIAGNCNTGLLNYSSNPNAASEQNDLGNDNYFSRTTTPGYAHSYLLTSVLSPDYVDSDNIKGPSDGDLGYYTTFHYSKIDNYKWRVPYELNTANFNEGLKTNASDDKASYLYGEKELWYLDSIVGKTHVAIFHTQARQDGLGVTGKDGGKNTDTTKAQRLLKKISLYVVKDRNEHGAQALPVKEVHFEYDYSLCKNIPNQLVPGQGKLTLKKVWFTYQNSNKGKMSPYRFVYSSVNPDYDITGYDRWGNYKRNTNSGCHPLSSDLNNAEYPYTTMIKDTADLFSQAWSLSQIKLPSGGIIQVEYESDDYGWVQHKRAMQMFRILGTEGETNTEGVNELVSVSDDAIKNRVLYFELHPEFDGNISEYFKGIDDLYFRCLSNMHPSDNSKLDYVSGYAKPEEYGTTMLNGDLVGYVKLYPAKLRDNGSTIYNPISVAAIQFGRRHLGEYVWDRPQIDDSQGLGADILSAIILSVTNIGQVFSTPNNSLWNKGIGKKIVTHKSWIRLNNPTKRKYGGGSRVKKILMSDNWNTMTDFQETSFAYGQEYQYKNADGTSSGVAAYEPQLGGDENPWKQPDSYSEKVKLMPDDQFYSEKPYGESFFPGPSVGYARVEVKNLERLGVTR
ncbi:MAG TPA: hypothetical protein PK637_17110, partial [Flavobacteriales bacterium]|nr:hypothetical protein [Flavobacteriales bacterium]